MYEMAHTHIGISPVHKHMGKTHIYGMENA